jgi:hypothetical protein
MPLVYVILFYFIFFLCFLCFTGLRKKMRHFWKSGLKEQKGEKLEFVQAIEHKRRAMDRTSSCAPKARIECTYVRSPKKEIDHSAIECTKCDQAHLCARPTPATALFWKFLVFRVLVIPCCTRIQPYDFRVSRTLLDFINRLVNTEKVTRYFGEEFTTFKEVIFRVYSFPLLYL